MKQVISLQALWQAQTPDNIDPLNKTVSVAELDYQLYLEKEQEKGEDPFYQLEDASGVVCLDGEEVDVTPYLEGYQCVNPNGETETRFFLSMNDANVGFFGLS